MREIKVEKDETLESAYARLKEAQFKFRQDVYMYYNGKKIVSNQTLNEAYKDVFGSTKVDLEERERQKQIAALEEEEDTRAYIYTPEDVVRDIIVSELIDKKDVNENWVSSVADSYLAGMYMYTKYCKEVTIENWIETISGYVHNIRKKDPEDNKKYLYTDEEIIAHLDFYEKLGNILKAVTKETPWDDIKKLVASYNFNNEEIEKLKDRMCFYSIMGEEFVTNVFGKGPMTYKND